MTWLNWLVESALKNRIQVLSIFFALSTLGITAAIQLPLDAVPDIANVQVIINTKTGALDPGKVEKLVTYPIEAEMAGLPAVEDIRSLSKYGLSQITLVFEEKTNLLEARQRVAERLQNVRASLPEELSPQIAPSTTGLGEILMYELKAKKDSPLATKPEKELFGISVNLMSLGAIDFGLLVDGAIVLIENIVRRLESYGGRAINRSEKLKIILESTKEVLKPLSLGIHQAYEPTLKLVLEKNWLVIPLILGPALIALILFFRLGSDFIPELDEGDLVINLARSTEQSIDV